MKAVIVIKAVSMSDDMMFMFCICKGFYKFANADCGFKIVIAKWSILKHITLTDIVFIQ